MARVIGPFRPGGCVACVFEINTLKSTVASTRISHVHDGRVVYSAVSGGGSRIFERGGGVQARIQDFSQAPPPPWTLPV